MLEPVPTEPYQPRWSSHRDPWSEAEVRDQEGC